MFFGDIDSPNLIGNRDFHYEKLSNKLSGFHSRIQVSVGSIFLTFGHHFHSLGHPFGIPMAARNITLPISAISSPLFWQNLRNWKSQKSLQWHFGAKFGLISD